MKATTTPPSSGLLSALGFLDAQTQSHLILWKRELTPQEFDILRRVESKVESGGVYPLVDLDCVSYYNGPFDECLRHWKEIPSQARRWFVILEISDERTKTKIVHLSSTSTTKTPNTKYNYLTLYGVA
ncbi:MAG: hypothetical protein LBO72_02015 [Helicobacteraceae bacterium]|jgi:hypothetical protein|nr:hypothetical protein [Helicobacteraceae bacterium]